MSSMCVEVEIRGFGIIRVHATPQQQWGNPFSRAPMVRSFGVPQAVDTSDLLDPSGDPLDFF